MGSLDKILLYISLKGAVTAFLLKRKLHFKIVIYLYVLNESGSVLKCHKMYSTFFSQAFIKKN